MDVNTDSIAKNKADGEGCSWRPPSIGDELPRLPAPGNAGVDAEAIWLREICGIPLLSFSDEVRLARASRKGHPESRNAMIKHNLRLVLSLARKYRNRGLHLLDMVSEGNLGLMRAVEKYDADLGYRFSTYATWWVRQAIDRSIMNHARDVRLPVHVIKEVSQCRRNETRLAHQLGRLPTRSELAEYCGKTLPELNQLLDCHESSHDSQQVIPSSEELEADCIYDDGDFSNPVRPVQLRGIKQTTWRWLNELSETQREVIVRRFGLGGHTSATLEQVGADIGLTRERVRQIQLHAMKRLRRLAEQENYGVDAFFGADPLSECA